MNHFKCKHIDITKEEFIKNLCENDLFQQRPKIVKDYIHANIPRLYRIFRNMILSGRDFKGPTLDMGSGWGILYPIYKKFFPAMFPCYMAELFCYELEYEGEPLPCVQFECEKDELPYEDSSLGLIVCCDVLEHLIIDPVYTILELNRVLKTGGYFILNTPNVLAGYRILNILAGKSPATENEIRPSSIYQRHNREWTPDEVRLLMECCGFGRCMISTNEDKISPQELELLGFAKQKGLLNLSIDNFGPDIFCVAEKLEHRTPKQDLPKDQRWPQWLYSSLDIYRRRPKIYPIHAENPEIELMDK